MGLTSTGRFVCRTDLVGCVSSLDIPLASGGRPQALTPFRGCQVYRLAPLFGGIPTGPETFWGLPDASDLLPCDRTHIKKRPFVTIVRLVRLMTNIGTIQQRQTWGRKAPGIVWATFGWASCIIVQHGLRLGSNPISPLPPTIINLRVIDLL